MAGSHSDNRSVLNFSIGSSKIILKLGDIFNETDVDVIVVPTPNSGSSDSKTYPMFEKLLKKHDNKIQNEIKRLSQKIEPKEGPQLIKSTKPPYMLTATPYFQNEKAAFSLLQSTYRTCLRIAVQNGYKTIAFPTIGCGNSGFNPKDAAENLFKALTQFESSEMLKLREIRIIIYNNEIYDQFTKAFKESSTEKKSKIRFEEKTKRDSDQSNPDKGRREHEKSKDEHYEDDFDNSDDDRRRRDEKSKERSRLNPDCEEFKPRNANKTRDIRKYQINKNGTELVIEQGDILKTKVDAIVNAANEEMLGGGGVDGIIHDEAGSELLRACRAHKEIFPRVRLPTGRSRILLSYNMRKTTHYIINTAGPRYDRNAAKECKTLLTSCYTTSLALAKLYDLETIAFTAISCGIFDYPTDEGAEVALTTVAKEAGSMREIRFVLKDDAIYDAWVRKADELQFNSFDPINPSNRESSTKPKKTKDESPEKSSENNTSKGGKKSIVSDASNPKRDNKPEKKPKSDDDDDDQQTKQKNRKGSGSPPSEDENDDKAKSKSKKENDEKHNSDPPSPPRSSESNKSSNPVGYGRGKKPK